MHSIFPRPNTRSCRQRGSVLVNAVIALSLIVIVLIGSELGYLFYLKREFQKSADLSALAGAQALVPDNCTSATAAAIANASQNLPSGFQMTAADVVCGRWDPENQPSPRHFSPGMQPFNAVSVSIQRTPPLLLPSLPGNQPRVLSLEALAAKTDPSAAFSVGSRLLRLSGDSTLGALLKAIGLNLDNTIVAGYEGLATVSITPGGLLCTPPLEAVVCPAANITVGGLNDLLNNNVTLGQLLDAVVVAGGHNELLGANVALIDALKAKLGVQNLNLQLGSANSNSGLFALISTQSANSALDAKINALDLIQAAIGIASEGHAVNAALPVDLLGLVTISSKVGIVEPPSIAIGSRGITAYTAQVRTYIQIQTSGALAALVKLNLPIVIDLVTATAKLEELCTPALVSSTGKQRASFDVQGTILKGCIGKIANSTGTQDCSLAASDAKHQACLDNLLFSKKDACEQNLYDTELLNVLGLARTTNSTSLNVLPLREPTLIVLEEGQTGTAGNELSVGATVINLVNTISDLLFTAPPPPTDAATAAAQIWAATGDSVANGGAGCTADTTACREKRLKNARQRIEANAAQSGLIDGLLTGIGDLLGAVGGIAAGDGCSYTGLLGGVLNPTSNSKCIKLIEGTLNKNSPSLLGGLVSNVLAVVTGLLKQLQPVLDAIGNSLLTPLLRDLLGIHLGEVDVKLQTLQCNNAQLVY
ncbi:Protein of unknown function DUF2134, membrane [Variovorax paradoxus EPS]|uniref:DUF2134 domain-containing protein n=1 Tax=Variovorax paradoxus (strain EPS) TaxID=595537 RepID=E6V562_VARPE|nr:Protein of unknown function DUF2134, membrane [Variovorax paradoxus EPS]